MKLGFNPILNFHSDLASRKITSQLRNDVLAEFPEMSQHALLNVGINSLPALFYDFMSYIEKFDTDQYYSCSLTGELKNKGYIDDAVIVTHPFNKSENVARQINSREFAVLRRFCGLEKQKIKFQLLDDSLYPYGKPDFDHPSFRNWFF